MSAARSGPPPETVILTVTQLPTGEYDVAISPHAFADPAAWGNLLALLPDRIAEQYHLTPGGHQRLVRGIQTAVREAQVQEETALAMGEGDVIPFRKKRP